MDLSANNGLTGNLLLDPTTINVVEGSATSGSLDASILAGILNFSALDISADTLSVGTLQALGDINITLQAKDTIRIRSVGGASTFHDLSSSLFSNTLTLQAGDATTVNGGQILFNSGSAISTGGGNVSIIAGNASQATGNATLNDIATGGGNITVTAQQAITSNGLLDASEGTVFILMGCGSMSTGL